jgi:hypothetical protein
MIHVIRSATKALWNGPFYVGKLERPISVGEALLKLFETAWRAGVLFIIFWIVVIAAIAMGVGIEALRQPNAKDMTASVRLFDPGCGVEFPITTRVQNRSWFADAKVIHLSVAASRKGSSENLISAPAVDHTALTRPSRSTDLCWQFSDLPLKAGEKVSDLDWSVAVSGVE